MPFDSEEHSSVEFNPYLKTLNAVNSDLTAFNFLDMMEGR
jgi:hypothetical protein